MFLFISVIEAHTVIMNDTIYPLSSSSTGDPSEELLAVGVVSSVEVGVPLSLLAVGVGVGVPLSLMGVGVAVLLSLVVAAVALLLI